jgi:hypothetical protein
VRVRGAIIIFIVGLAVGYGLGFRDSKTHDRHIVARLVERAGGSHRENVKTDVDSQMERLER